MTPKQQQAFDIFRDAVLPAVIDCRMKLLEGLEGQVEDETLDIVLSFLDECELVVNNYATRR